MFLIKHKETGKFYCGHRYSSIYSEKDCFWGNQTVHIFLTKEAADTICADIGACVQVKEYVPLP